MPKLIDLSHVIDDGMVTYPGLPAPRISAHLTREESRDHYGPGTEFHIGKIEMVGNTGTYLDTPFHRFAGGFDVADLPLEQAADLPAVCVAASGPRVGPDTFTEIDVSGRAVLIATGWSRHWGTDEYGSPGHPFLSEEAAAALADRDAALVGIDSVNIDDTRSGDRPAHTVLLAAGIPVVEHLTNLGGLVGAAFRFFAVPVRVRGLGTFPVRAFAVAD
jgi:kynurenine formamidase